MTDVDLSFWLDLLLVGLLAATIVYCFMVNRRLSKLRDAQGEMARMIHSFDEATEKARHSVEQLRVAAIATAADLDKQVGEARRMLDELSLVTRSGEHVAERIEKGVESRKPVAPAAQAPAEPRQPAARDPKGRAAAESQLLQALRKAR